MARAGQLFTRIRSAAAGGRYLIGNHAANQLDDRQIHEWQAVAGLAEGRLLRERPNDRPNPCVEVEQLLPDGTPVKAVWSWLRYNELAKLVTLHYFDR